MLCMASSEGVENSKEADDQSQDKTKAKEFETETNRDDELNAATKGKGQGKKGGKGYGECWHCGEWGHPRRECPHLNDPSKAKGALSALKGVKGKGKKGKNGKGKGKNGWGKGFGYQYRAPGKGVGKGFNQVDNDWYSAWGTEYADDYNYYQDDYANMVVLL